MTKHMGMIRTCLQTLRLGPVLACRPPLVHAFCMMIIRLHDVLPAAAAARLAESLSGRVRGGRPTSRVASEVDAEVEGEAGRRLADALRAHPLFCLGVQPSAVAPVTFACHEMGRCTDIHPPPGGERTALARVDAFATVLLSDPADYDGGELLIDSGYGDETYREGAGVCVVLPASASHRVAPVTRGTRWSGTLRVQSRVRDPAQREILYDMGCALHYLELFGGGTQAEGDRLRRSYDGLLRLWAEP
ncbi:Fe2+-dependent dioxygenase [Nannocystis pusilla]|uniref:Fe2+-dependent dioxygenase n=1 Tax=Nannocystis pusilla TaxID=889268 RepID=UPI003DA374CD